MITIVSGLPRSGTSLMMQMLAAGGMPVMADEFRPADMHNPRGYLEDRRVMSLERDHAWLHEAEGMALKVVSLLLYSLPNDLQYRVLFMRRDLEEVLRSQQSMLAAGTADVQAPPPEIRLHFERHLMALEEWFPRQTHLELLEIDYRTVIDDPHTTAIAVEKFLQRHLDVAAMTSVIDPTLYRQRSS